jgi:hypothetical protein
MKVVIGVRRKNNPESLVDAAKKTAHTLITTRLSTQRNLRPFRPMHVNKTISMKPTSKESNAI